MKKKILIATDAARPQINGVVTTLENTKNELEKRGYEVFVIEPSLFFNFKCPIYKEIDLAIPLTKKIEKIINEFDPDYVHIATEWSIGLLTRRILNKKGQKWSSSFHTRFPEYMEEKFGFGKELIWKILRKIYKNDIRILTTTSTMSNVLVDNGFDKNNLVIWSRGVDENLIIKKSNENKEKIFLNVGRVSIEKNLEDFYKLKLPGKKIQVGSGPMLDEYKEKYPDVTFLGPKSGKELYEIYSSSDVFVFPSKSDTFGLVMIEAMRCGIPVAAFPVTGPIDVIDNNITGIMDENLEKACIDCLNLNNDIIFDKSKKYSWNNATDIFEYNLIPIKLNT